MHQISFLICDVDEGKEKKGMNGRKKLKRRGMGEKDESLKQVGTQPLVYQ